MKPTVADRIKERLGRFTEALESGECIQEQFTCRKVEFRLNPQPYDPQAVKKTRKAIRCQPEDICGFFLGTSVKTVQAWEQGTSAPNKMACRFMDLIQRDPEYWR